LTLQLRVYSVSERKTAAAESFVVRRHETLNHGATKLFRSVQKRCSRKASRPASQNVMIQSLQKQAESRHTNVWR